MHPFAIINEGPYHEYVATDDDPLTTSQHSLSVLPTISSLRRTSDLNNAILCEWFPILIQWRLLVFYAPFYSFDSAALRQNARLSVFEIRPYGRSLKRVLSQKTTRVTTHKALQQAEDLLKNMSVREGGPNLINLYNKLRSEKESYRRRTKLTGIKSFAFLPTLQALERVSNSTDIPLFQLELALAAYARYLHLFQQDTPYPQESSREYVRQLDVQEMVDQKQWQELAQIVYQDARDVATYSIFPYCDRDKKGRSDEMLMFRHAVVQCSEYYFADLEVEQARCGCGWTRTMRPSYNMRRGVHRHYGYDRDSRIGNIATPWFLSTLWSNLARKWCFEIRKHHVAKRISGTRENHVRYRLDRREEVHMDGSYELIKQKLRDTRGDEGRHHGSSSSDALRSSTEAGTPRTDSTDVLPGIRGVN